MPTVQKFLVIKDRVEIYKDFTINLTNYIIDYYLDNVTLSNDVDIKNHYNFCFNKVCDEFKKEEIDFTNNDGIREYYYTFFYNQFYKIDNEGITAEYYEKFWRNIFDIKKQKSKNMINTLVEVYSVFDQTINNLSPFK